MGPYAFPKCMLIISTAWLPALLLLELSVGFLCSLYCLLFLYQIKVMGMLSLCSKEVGYSSEHYSEYFSFSHTHMHVCI